MSDVACGEAKEEDAAGNRRGRKCAWTKDRAAAKPCSNDASQQTEPVRTAKYRRKTHVNLINGADHRPRDGSEGVLVKNGVGRR